MDAQYFRNNFNTELTPLQEKSFDQWLKSESKRQKRDMSKDLEDYDLRGFWMSHGQKDKQTGHGPDTFKKPNHPTFSEDSKYHGIPDGMGGMWSGGRWIGDDKHGWSFQPSNSMLYRTVSMNQLQQYFADNEPDVTLVPPYIFQRGTTR